MGHDSYIPSEWEQRNQFSLKKMNLIHLENFGDERLAVRRYASVLGIIEGANSSGIRNVRRVLTGVAYSGIRIQGSYSYNFNPRYEEICVIDDGHEDQYWHAEEEAAMCKNEDDMESALLRPNGEDAYAKNLVYIDTAFDPRRPDLVENPYVEWKSGSTYGVLAGRERFVWRRADDSEVKRHLLENKKRILEQIWADIGY